jgi:Na+/melibiose symporter-like transporter
VRGPSFDPTLVCNRQSPRLLHCLATLMGVAVDDVMVSQDRYAYFFASYIQTHHLASYMMLVLSSRFLHFHLYLLNRSRYPMNKKNLVLYAEFTISLSACATSLTTFSNNLTASDLRYTAQLTCLMEREKSFRQVDYSSFLSKDIWQPPHQISPLSLVCYYY